MEQRIIPQNKKKTFFQAVVALVVPMALQNLINVGIQSADVIMLGKVDEIALSSASLAGQIQFVLMLILFGLSSGAAVLTAQYWGKGDTRTIERILGITLRFSVSVAVVFVIAVYTVPASLMRILTPDEQIIAGGVEYLRFIAPSYLVISFTNIYLNIMRSTEKTIISTIVYFISLITNIVLNSIFIFGLLGVPAMGVAGAALATTLARVIELCIVLIYAIQNPIIRLRIRDITGSHPQLMTDFRKFALPTTLNELLWSLGISANAAIIGHLSAQAVAANSISQVVRQLATVVSFGVANAAATLIGKAIGSNDYDSARYIARRMVSLSVISGCVGAVAILILRPFVVEMMSMSELTSEYLRFILLCMSLYVIAQAINATAIVGVFRGGGDIRFGLYLDIGFMWGFSILLGMLGTFVFHWPPKTILAILMVDELLKVPISLLRCRSSRWLNNVTRECID